MTAYPINYGRTRNGVLLPVQPAGLLKLFNKELAAQVRDVRKAEPNSDEQRELKSALPFFLFHETVTGFRGGSDNFEQTGYICFDIDHLGADVGKILKKIRADERMFFSYVSARGEGIKIVVQLAQPITDQAEYQYVYERLMALFGEKWGVKMDKTSDCARIQYLGSDPVLNERSTPVDAHKKLILEYRALTKKEKQAPTAQNCFGEQVDSALTFLREETGYLDMKDEDRYHRTGMALTSLGDEGLEKFIAFALPHPLYPKDTEKKIAGDYKRFLGDRTRREARGQKVLGIGSLIKDAMDLGWKPQKKEIPLPTEAWGDRVVAARFAREHARVAKHNTDRDCWMIWDGSKWVNADKHAMRLMSETINGIYTEAFAQEDGSSRKANLLRLGHSYDSVVKRRLALESASNLAELEVREEDLDADPVALNVLNGWIDLRDQTFHEEHDPAKMCSKVADVQYERGAKCPRWDAHLMKVFKGDQELIAFMWRAIGYSLTGLTDADALFFCYGTGCNGKTVTLEVIRKLLGDYADAAPTNMLMASQYGDDHRGDKAELKGMRFVTVSETSTGRRFDEEAVKQLTGGDKLTAERKYERPFTFEATHKLWMYGNHKPVIEGTDEGIWRRPKIIPFTVDLSKSGKIIEKSELYSAFEEEHAGILCRALAGLADYQKRKGLAAPETVTCATQAYRKEQDVVGQFLSEACERAGEMPTSELHQAFRDWGGDAKLSARSFFNMVAERGYEYKTGHANRRVWVNLSLKKLSGPTRGKKDLPR